MEVITRRTQYDLREAEKRAHILQGLLIALDNLDAVIKLIRSARDPETARNGLIEQFSLSEPQAGLFWKCVYNALREWSATKLSPNSRN